MNDNRFQSTSGTRHQSSGLNVSGRGTDETATMATRMLNRGLQLVRVTALRCKREYHTALRLHSPHLAAAALEHANDTGGHAHRIRERISELGGEAEPLVDVSLPLQRTELQARNPLAAVIADDLSSVRATLDGYREIAAFFESFDPSTCRLMTQIIDGENERADDLVALLAEASAHPTH